MEKILSILCIIVLINCGSTSPSTFDPTILKLTCSYNTGGNPQSDEEFYVHPTYINGVANYKIPSLRKASYIPYKCYSFISFNYSNTVFQWYDGTPTKTIDNGLVNLGDGIYRRNIVWIW